jgi:hypothetical protein
MAFSQGKYQRIVVADAERQSVLFISFRNRLFVFNSNLGLALENHT